MRSDTPRATWAAPGGRSARAGKRYSTREWPYRTGKKRIKMIVGIVVEFQELKVQKFGKNNLSRVLLEAIDGTRATARYPRCSVRLPA